MADDLDVGPEAGDDGRVSLSDEQWAAVAELSAASGVHVEEMSEAVRVLRDIHADSRFELLKVWADQMAYPDGREQVREVLREGKAEAAERWARETGLGVEEVLHALVEAELHVDHDLDWDGFHPLDPAFACEREARRARENPLQGLSDAMAKLVESTAFARQSIDGLGIRLGDPYAMVATGEGQQ